MDALILSLDSYRSPVKKIQHRICPFDFDPLTRQMRVQRVWKESRIDEISFGRIFAFIVQDVQ